MIIAKSDTPCNDWEYTDAIRNYLYGLLNDTIYTESKKKDYEYLIQGDLSQEEYEAMKYKFYTDKIDAITMKGAGNMGEVKHRLSKLK